MLEEFRKFIREKSLITKSDRILLAVSGGIDSMSMANLFMSISADIGIAHCNFQLRGKESDKDELFVRKFAEANNIPVYVQKFDTSGFAAEKGISIQMAARELRYRWFEEIRHNQGYSLIAVAHNLNDNVETFLINLTRGTGIAGLTGMKPRYKNIIRPLLFASREAINGYCNTNNINFREDKSNAETKYTRNRIRHIIVPEFKSINPSFDVTVTETAERLSEIHEIVVSTLEQIKKKVTFQKENETIFKISLLQELYPLNTFLFELFRQYGVSRDQLAELTRLLKSRTGSQLITSSHRLIRNRKELIAVKLDEKQQDDFIVANIGDFKKIPGCISATVRKTDGSFKIPSSTDVACLDAEKLSFPMVIRRWKHGDVFYPLGMKHKKKLSDYFVDNRYSVFDKENCQILQCGSDIIWLIKDRIDDRYKITAQTRKALIIRMKKQEIIYSSGSR